MWYLSFRNIIDTTHRKIFGPIRHKVHGEERRLSCSFHRRLSTFHTHFDTKIITIKNNLCISSNQLSNHVPLKGCCQNFKVSLWSFRCWNSNQSIERCWISNFEFLTLCYNNHFDTEIVIRVQSGLSSDLIVFPIF